MPSKTDSFDLAAWADRMGYPASRSQAREVANVLKLTQQHTKELLEGRKPPGRGTVALAEALERIRELEGQAPRSNPEAGQSVIDHLHSHHGGLAMSGAELMRVTRGDPNDPR